MPANRIERVLRNSEAVTQRMQESKKEIEVLRAEYERLMERGLQAGTSNITDTDKQKEMEILSKREEREVQGMQAGGGQAAGDNQRVGIQRKASDKLASIDSSRTALEQGSPPKVRHYKAEDAREYIRKQKERRLQQQKQQKETDNALELKKQKLKELHQKSLQIVARNRQRSKSREKRVADEVPAPAPPSKQVVQQVPPKTEIKLLEKVITKPIKPHLNLHPTINITHRTANTSKLKKVEVKYVKSSAKSDDAKIKAATLIQAYFRGHIQRKLYRDVIKQRTNARQAQNATQRSQTASKKENQLIVKDTTQNTSVVNVEPKELEKKFPDWLQLEPTYHPYNFINSVKRKLNVALSTPAKTSDVGIQSSFSELCAANVEVLSTPQRYKEMKEKIELSLGSQKADKEINAKIEQSLEAIRNVQREQLANGGTASSKDSKHSSKMIVNGHDKYFLELDAKKLDKLRLHSDHSDHSDSDTSKNIPDISTESKYKSSTFVSCTSQSSLSQSVTSAFKHPKEPPPKPKRLSRHELHASRKDNASGVSSESQKFAQHAAEHLDEYKLTIDVEKLKNIKLQRRYKAAPGLENTMLQYEDSKHSSNSRKSSNNVDLDSSSSIETISGRSRSLAQSEKQSNVEESSSSSSQYRNTQKTNENSQVASSLESRHSHSGLKSQSIQSDGSKSSKNSSKSVKSQHANVVYSSDIGSRRDSTITGNITRYTKTFDLCNTKASNANAKNTIIDDIQEIHADQTSEIPENLSSFRQYMKELDETQKITRTPFQPRGQGAIRGLNAEKRLQEVISKVNLLDQSQSTRNPTEKSAVNSSNGSKHSTILEELVTDKKTRPETIENLEISQCDKPEVEKVDKVEVEEETVKMVPSKEDKLIPPNVNLIVVKCTDDNKENKLSARTSSETVANGPTNQIHVKFEAELHLLNDFNESLKQIMNIEKSMLDLQTKYNLQPSRETRDTQTSVITSQSITKSVTKTSNTNASNALNSATASIIERSVNFSRGSDIEENLSTNDGDDKVIVLHRNTNLMDSSRSNSHSTLNISDITFNNSMNSLQSTQNAITLNTSATNAAATPREKESPNNKFSSVGLSVGMFDQLISDEDARIDNLKAVLKIREKTLLDRTKGELTWLEIQKKHLLETGKLHEASLLKKKQRGIILRLQEEKNEMQRLKEAQKAASKERKTKLKEQCALIKAQLKGPHGGTRIRRASERRASGPVKVYQSEYYQSETSVSRKSSDSVSESVVYASRSASIISHPDDGAAVASRTEVAKRSLQTREAALQRRRKEAEDLLRWHQKLLREERKIAELEMAASNVINQVPAATIWKENAVAPTKAKSKSIENIADETGGSKYSTDFDSGKDGESEKGGVQLSQQSDSLNEIMQNINNITDEISELYKLSSMQKSLNLDGKSATLSEHLLTDDSGNKSHDSTASIISRPKSVPEVSVIVEEKVPSVVSNEVSSRIASKTKETEAHSESKKSFFRLQSKKLSLHEVQLPEREETEDDVSSIKSEVQNELQKSSEGSIAVPSRSHSHDETSDACETLKEQNHSVIESKSDNEPDLSIKSVVSDVNQSEKSSSVIAEVHEEILQDIISAKSSLETSQQIADEKVQLQETNQTETCEKSSVVVENIDDNEIIPSSKDISEVTEEENKSALEIVSVAEVVEQDVSVLPSSKLNTISESYIEEKQEEQHSKASEIVSIRDENLEFSKTFAIEEKEIEENEQTQIESDVSEENLCLEALKTVKEDTVLSESEANLTYSSEIRLEDVVKDVGVVEEEVEDAGSVEDADITGLSSNESKTFKSSDSEDVEEVLPIIGVKIEEKKQTLDVEDVDELESLVEVSNVEKEAEDFEGDKESSYEIEVESSITDECVVEDNVDEEEELSSKKLTIDVKKRVSEILADANLNASIEEKSPRLPDIYVTTYDVISPDNSPELGSPVDSSKDSSNDSKTKPKDVFGIGNEAQELLKKQLAIEQEIKQIERQQKEQLPYIFVREIPNKPPPPYTPPVQQPTSIVPATPAQIDELAPHLAEIFHRGFAEKTLEYVTFPDTQLDQLENVDKICAEFLFDIAKEYALRHYKQFVGPDEKAPPWMRLDKPKSFKRPHTQRSLELVLKKHLKQLFAFEKSDLKESMIIKWSRKKRDHVDELLVVESQSEEAEWTNYDQDELIVREEITTNLVDMLIEETALCLAEIFARREVAESHC